MSCHAMQTLTLHSRMSGHTPTTFGHGLMKYRFTYALLFLTVLAHSQPKPQLDSTTWYCGVSKTDSGNIFHIEKRFEIKNIGDEPLIIQTGLGDGGGAHINCQKEPIAPGESGFCEFVYGSRGDIKYRRKLKLHWLSDEREKEILLTFTGGKKYYTHKGPILKADSNTYRLGVIKGGRNRIDSHHLYTMRIPLVNVGDQPAVLTRATTSDGGTMLTWPKEPIMPGDTVFCIFHYYHLARRVGPFSKSVTITYMGRDEKRIGIYMHVNGRIEE